MNKLVLILSLIVIMFLSQAISSLPLEAKSKHKSSKKFKKSKFKPKKQTLEESLSKLEKYFPAFNKENNEFDLNLVSSLNLKDNSVFQENENRLRLLENINDWLTTPYRRAGRTKKGIDCSNFTSVMVNNALGWKFPSSPGAQYHDRNVELIKNAEDLQFGDLVFFTGRNRKSNRIGHVGFYIGNGLFAHSSSGRGVIYTHISESYYTPRFRGGGRIVSEQYTALQVKN